MACMVVCGSDELWFSGGQLWVLGGALWCPSRHSSKIFKGRFSVAKNQGKLKGQLAVDKASECTCKMSSTNWSSEIRPFLQRSVYVRLSKISTTNMSCPNAAIT